MSSTISANSAGGGGLVSSGDASGVLQLQTGGITGLQVDASQKVTFANSLTSPTLVTPVISGAVVSAMGSSVLTSGTAVASTSGTSIDFTGIPSWAKRITVMFNGVSLSGTSDYLIQLGSGSVTSTGYSGGQSTVNGTNTCAIGANTNGLTIRCNGAGNSHVGFATFLLLNGFIYVGNVGMWGNGFDSAATAVTLSGTLDRVRITTVNGTDTFDAGTINILYE